MRQGIIIMSKHELPSTSTNTREHVPAWRRFAALGLLSSVALTGCAAQHVSAETPASSPVPSAAASETPSTAETTRSQAEIETEINQLKIPTGLDNQTLATTFMDRVDKWTNAGDSESLKPVLMKTTLGRDGLAHELAEDNQQIYATALFGPDWQNNPAIKNVADGMAEENAWTLGAYMGTAWNNNTTANGAYEYRRWTEVLNVVEQSGANSSRNFKITYKNHDNADGAAVATNAMGDKVDDLVVGVTFVPDNAGSEVITDIAFVKASS